MKNLIIREKEGTLNMNNQDRKIYIYNKEQALFYINNGVFAIDSGKHYASNKQFWVFNRQATNNVFKLWMHNKQ
jgi:frataxin-like iron-binding protein CyaY